MTPIEILQRRLDRREVVILDGGTSTELERRGVPMDAVAWSGAALRTHPEVVRQVHEDYVRAGADIVITNTFAACRHTLESAGLGDLVGELNTLAVALAREAVDAAMVDRPVHVAGSISTFKPGNSSDLMPSADGAKANYLEQAELLAQAGVDLLMMEMMRDLEQSAFAIEAAVSTGLPVWVGYSCKLGGDDRQVNLLSPTNEVFADALGQLAALGGSLVAVMHTEIEDIVPALRVAQERWRGPLGAYPHSGGFIMPNWQFEDILSPEDYLAQARTWVEMGVQVIGGCCGTTPEHIRLLREGLPTHIPPG